MSFTVFDCVYSVDGVDRDVRFRVPGTPGSPQFAKDVVFWVHGGGLDGRMMSGIVPARASRIDVFPTALHTNGEVGGVYSPPALTTTCSAPRGWALPGMPVDPPFATGGCAPGMMVLPGDPPHNVRTDIPADPMCPRLVVQGTLDTWTDLRFLCLLMTETRAGTPPAMAVGGVSIGGGALTPWATLPQWGAVSAGLRFWFAGFSKGAMLVLWAHAYNNPAAHPAGSLAYGVTGISELANVSGYWISSASMPDTARNGLMENFASPAFGARVTRKICGYWHGGVADDTIAQEFLPGLPYPVTARALSLWYGVRWTPWTLVPGMAPVCSGSVPVPIGGLVRRRVAIDYTMMPPLRVLAHYQVLRGGHVWSWQEPTCAAGAWDEALVATHLWRHAGYGS